MASRSTCDGLRRPPARAGLALPQPAPVPRADGRGRAHARGAAALGGEPLLLPEVHPAQGRRDPGELPRGRGPSPVDPAHRRPRRHDRGHRWHRVVAAARRGARRHARRAGVGAGRAARRALCGRRVREFRAAEALDRGGRVVADRALRSGRDERRGSRRSSATIRGSTLPASTTSARGSSRRRETRSTRSTSPSSAARRRSSRTPPSRPCASRPRCCGRSSTPSSTGTRSRDAARAWSPARDWPTTTCARSTSS